MNAEKTKRELTSQQITPLLSPYLTGGRKQESWFIDSVVIEGNRLSAKVVMTSIYTSATDTKGFHLTIFSTLEFLSQLMIVFAHEWAGLKAKIREGWMVESSTRSVRAIRNPDEINVDMHVQKIYKRGVNLYCVADFRVTDDVGGLFEISLKGFMS